MEEQRVDVLQAQVAVMFSVLHILTKLVPQAKEAVELMREPLLAHSLGSAMTGLKIDSMQRVLNQLIGPARPAP